MLASAISMKHSKTVPSLLIRNTWFLVCFSVVLILCLLYITDKVSNRTYLAAVESSDSHDDLERNPSQRETSPISLRLQDFRHEWLRQRRARVDWLNIIRPCVDNMAWGLVKDHWGKINRSNAAISDVIFTDIRPAGEFSKIFIQSKTSDNRTKLIGGDTWRVYVRGPSSVAVTIFDHNNGTYEALFLIMEPGVYQLLIYLDYSLCDGFRDPPRDWFIKGNAQGDYHRNGILGYLDDYLIQPFKNGQPLNITILKAQLKISLLGKYKSIVLLQNKQNTLHFD